MPHYRYVRWLIAYGSYGAVFCILGFLGAGIWFAATGLVAPFVAVLIALLGLVTAFLLMVLVDISKLIAEMLLPR